MAISIHPAVDQGVKPGMADFAGGTVRCQCSENAVEVTVASQTANSHVCGLHPVLEAGGRDFLANCDRPA